MAEIEDETEAGFSHDVGRAKAHWIVPQLTPP
jgi:hypothetical protein